MELSRRSLLLGLGAGAFLRSLPAAAASRYVVATTRTGRVRGVVEHGVSVFRGVPYGSARRFLPPRAPAAWQGTRDALAFGPASPQHGSDERAGEDCLVLNAWTPALRDGRQYWASAVRGSSTGIANGTTPVPAVRAIQPRTSASSAGCSRGPWPVCGFFSGSTAGDGRFSVESPNLSCRSAASCRSSVSRSCPTISRARARTASGCSGGCNASGVCTSPYNPDVDSCDPLDYAWPEILIKPLPANGGPIVTTGAVRSITNTSR